MTPEAKIFDRSKVATQHSIYVNINKAKKQQRTQHRSEFTSRIPYHDENPIPDKASKQDEARRERKADWLRKEREEGTEDAWLSNHVIRYDI